MISPNEKSNEKSKEKSNEKSFDVSKVREDFPILNRTVQGKPLVYLDNAATSQKPKQVISALSHYYENGNANIHRGIHTLSMEATEAHEDTRSIVKNFINAKNEREIIFTSGTTGSINLLASSFSRKYLHEGDEVILSVMEHHSNIVPWQIACEARGARLRVIPMNDRGELLLHEYEKMLSPVTKLVAVVHVSNTLGTVNPVRQIVEMAKRVGAKTLLDGAQAIPHGQVNVRELDCDFYAFSGHKMLAPTGIGVLYGREELLRELPPWQGGGEMIERVTFEKTSYNELPHKFEAGTPNIAGVVGIKAAIRYMEQLGMENMARHENDLLEYATEEIKKLPEIRIIGEAEEKVGVLSFVAEGIHPSDLGSIMDKLGVVVRTGHHCTEPLMDRLGIPGTVRASFAFYNTFEEVDIFIAALKRALTMLG